MEKMVTFYNILWFMLGVLSFRIGLFIYMVRKGAF
jgi:hypothetical protein